MIGSQLRVLCALESGLQIVPDIAKATGVPIPQVHARLHEFRRLGIVRAVRLWNPKRTPSGHRHGEKYKRYLLIRQNFA